VLPAQIYRKHLDWIEFQLHCAKAFDKPVVVLEPFGTHETIAPAVLEMGDEVVPGPAAARGRHQAPGASRGDDALRRYRVQARLTKAGIPVVRNGTQQGRWPGRGRRRRLVQAAEHQDDGLSVLAA